MHIDGGMICDHTVKQRPEGPLLLKKMLLILLYLLLGVAAWVTGVLLRNPLLFVGIGAFVIFAVWRLTYIYTKVEYEYEIIGRTLRHSVIYGGVSKKQLFEVEFDRIRSIECYASERGQKKLSDFAPEKEYFALSSRSGYSEEEREKVWICLFSGEKDLPTAFYFEMTDKAYHIFRYLGPTVCGGREMK